MNDLSKKTKPTLESLLIDQQIVTGQKLIERQIAADKQKALIEEAIEFERRNRRRKER